MCRRIMLLALMVLCSFALVATAQEAKPKKPLMDENEQNISKFMRAKLQHSQKLIESLAVEDYEAMAKSSQEMSLLTLAEQWQVLQTADYLHESTAFRRSADALTAAAKKKNLDGAALAYVEMTLQCVKCHKMVRHSKMASLDARAFEKLLAAKPAPNAAEQSRAAPRPAK
jgi:cytochrome c556